MTTLILQCDACHGELTMPLPDAVSAPDGTLLSAERMSLDASQAALLPSVPCPTCDATQWTVVEERISTKKTIPVYATYTLHLERYLEVEAETMEEAKAKVKAMVRNGTIQRPSYTEHLDDWTEITDAWDLGRLRIDGEVI